jgi:chromosome segregation ATPase
MLIEIDALKKRLSDVRSKAKTDIEEHAATIKTLQTEAKAARSKYAKAIKEIEELRDKAVEVN